MIRVKLKYFRFLGSTIIVFPVIFVKLFCLSTYFWCKKQVTHERKFLGKYLHFVVYLEMRHWDFSREIKTKINGHCRHNNLQQISSTTCFENGNLLGSLLSTIIWSLRRVFKISSRVMGDLDCNWWWGGIAQQNP